MKITKNDLKRIILETLNETNGTTGQVTKQPAVPQQSAREKYITKGLETGAKMTAGEYANNLKAVLLSTQVSNQNRIKALEALFPESASRLNSMILDLEKRVTKKEGNK